MSNIHELFVEFGVEPDFWDECIGKGSVHVVLESYSGDGVFVCL